MLHAAHGSNTVLRHGELVNAASQRSVDRARQNYPTTKLPDGLSLPDDTVGRRRAVSCGW
jgi:hypothetical protein